MRKSFAPFALLSIAAIWGMTFVMMVDPIQQQGVNDFLSFRFTLAAIILILIRPRVLRQISVPLLKKGGIAGIFLGGGFAFQTLGLSVTTPAITGFITGLYVVITPLLAVFVIRSKVTRVAWIAVLLATSGLLVLTFNGFEISWGAIAVFVSAIFYAAHIVALGVWSKDFDTYALTTVQIATCSLLTTVAALGNGITGPVGGNGWFVVIFTATAATVLAFLVQTWAQAIIASTTVAVLLTTEVFFAALFSVLSGTETLTIRVLIGGILVTAGMYLILLTDRPAQEISTKKDD